MLEKIFIIGLGLLGGSIAKAIKKNNKKTEIFAFDIDLEVIKKAKNEKIIDKFQIIDEEISKFDLIIIASPLASYDKILLSLQNFDLSNNLIIDIGSVKNLLKKYLKNKNFQNFFPCHPVAGSHLKGFENSLENLFEDKKFIICKENDSKNLPEKLDKFIKILKAKKVFLKIEKHDEIYALMSHLPQFLSFLDENPEIPTKELTFRLNKSDLSIWMEIFKFNEKYLEKYYLKFYKNYEKNIEFIEKNDFTKIAEKATNLAKNYEFKRNFTENDIILLKNEKIFFSRFVTVLSFLEIKEINDFYDFRGQGFIDFASILYLQCKI